jgi:hypothetical protein
MLNADCILHAALEEDKEMVGKLLPKGHQELLAPNYTTLLTSHGIFFP